MGRDGAEIRKHMALSAPLNTQHPYITLGVSVCFSHLVVFNSVTPWSVYGILQAKILASVAMPSSRGSS